MDYYQGVVTDYLRADRAMFLNTECCIQLDLGNVDSMAGRHWYCDAVAVNLRDKTVYLCEITYAATLQSLVKRLIAWHAHWDDLCRALVRDLHVFEEWPVRPWIFIPEARRKLLDGRFEALRLSESPTTGMPRPRVTTLETVAPWKYRSWDHVAD